MTTDLFIVRVIATQPHDRGLRDVFNLHAKNTKI
jgi:hypothetical protein